MVTMKELAEACHVSVATVSKALNDQSDISALTKERIRQRAGELGYWQDMSDRERKKDSSQNIGIVLCRRALPVQPGSGYAGALASFKHYAEKAGYDLTMIGCDSGQSDFDNHFESDVGQIQGRHLDGILVLGAELQNPQVAALLDSGIPAVTIGFSYKNRTAVFSDDMAGMRELFLYLHSMGHRRIVYIRGEGESGPCVPEKYMRFSAYGDAEGAYRETQHVLSLPVPPTCILYPDRVSCYGGVRAIRDRGLRIPEDISIVTFGRMRTSRHMDPGLTAVCGDADGIGKTAVESLIGQIEEVDRAAARKISVRSRLIIGNTVRNIAVRGAMV